MGELDELHDVEDRANGEVAVFCRRTGLLTLQPPLPNSVKRDRDHLRFQVH